MKDKRIPISGGGIADFNANFAEKNLFDLSMKEEERA